MFEFIMYNNYFVVLVVSNINAKSNNWCIYDQRTPDEDPNVLPQV